MRDLHWKKQFQKVAHWTEKYAQAEPFSEKKE